MPETVAFTVYGKAAPAGSKTVGFAKDGRHFVRDSSGKLGTEWRREVLFAARGIRWPQSGEDGKVLEGPLSLRVLFVVARPKGHYGKRGLLPSAPVYPTTRPDATKLLRAVEDALTGVLWRDDAQVVDQHVQKRYGEPVRAEITVTEVA